MTTTAQAPETTTLPAPEARIEADGTPLAHWWSDTLVFAGRNIEHIRQIPEKLLDVTLQPLMFVLLFAYVFGGAIAVTGGNYREFIIGGILIQSLAVGLTGPAPPAPRTSPGTTSRSSPAWRCPSSSSWGPA